MEFSIVAGNNSKALDFKLKFKSDILYKYRYYTALEYLI